MSDFIDPYINEESGILANRVGARTQDALDRAEAAFTYARQILFFTRHPVAPTGDIREILGIHRFLFQDVYGWAGELRTVEIEKSGRDSGMFMLSAYLNRGLEKVAMDLLEDSSLKKMKRSDFIERMAYHYDQLNYVHPFREGNGRTQRVFWTRIARDPGWEIDWGRAAKEMNDYASRVAMQEQNFDPLLHMFDLVTAQTRSTRPHAPDAR